MKNRNQLVNNLQLAQWMAYRARNRLERCLNQGRYNKGFARQYLRCLRYERKAFDALSKAVLA